jgi:hypothetical protein
MIIYVDIDDTICYYSGDDKKDLNYNKAKPYLYRIEKINKLYDEGNYIIYYTARGLKSGRGEQHYRPITEQQLGEWGCKYHELVFKSHDIDIFVDDRSIHPDQFFEEKDVSI